MKLFFQPEPASVRTKICGITSWLEAAAAIEAGADAIGINLVAGSKRQVTLAQAAGWIRQARHKIATVAVVMNPSFEEAEALLTGPLFDAIQLHGLESPEFCERLRQFQRPVIKAIEVSAEWSPNRVADYPVAAILLDSSAGSKLGGTGRTFAWEKNAGLVLAKPLILSGGLTPENVERAISLLHPYAVDVASGVEFASGRKDFRKIQNFVLAARRAAESWSARDLSPLSGRAERGEKEREANPA